MQAEWPVFNREFVLVVLRDMAPQLKIHSDPDSAKELKGLILDQLVQDSDIPHSVNFRPQTKAPVKV
jgi:hypothetical protein